MQHWLRNPGSRLYGKPLQNLDIEKGIRIIDNIVDGLYSLECINEIVLGISEGENEVFKTVAKQKGLNIFLEIKQMSTSIDFYVQKKADATDIFRVTSESPFLYHKVIDQIWKHHCSKNNDATFYDDIIDGCGFEFIRLSALQKSHLEGEDKHRSELCTLYIRENLNDFKFKRLKLQIILIEKIYVNSRQPRRPSNLSKNL